MIDVANSAPAQVLSFVREQQSDKVFVVLNFSAVPQTIRLRDDLYADLYTDHFSGQSLTLVGDSELTLSPWGYRVLVRMP